ncbi:hypothetical protein [Bradyrhizobium sp.]|uniref:hypothetical protein n=1 Tax=Bradyrhizobium sp. TaxID=376 RepID=UPI001ED183DA|nr:hypothetical protein [Bradyrhizobium sp.]MBV9984488.1 hypothetical protein [Bradyrhizobium sp.]
MTDTDTVGQALDVANKIEQGLDIASKFSGLTGPAAPFITGADIGMHLLTDWTTLVYNAHKGGKSWSESFAEVVSHMTPGMPNSPILSGPAA